MCGADRASELGWLAADRKESSDQSQYARYFQSAANQARTGDRDTAQSLVGEFAQLLLMLTIPVISSRHALVGMVVFAATSCGSPWIEGRIERKSR